MKTKIVTSLTGESLDGKFEDNTGIMQRVLEEPEKGFFRSTQLGRGGLHMKRGEFSVAIPLEVLWNFATSIEPELKPLPPKEPTPPMDAV